MNIATIANQGSSNLFNPFMPIDAQSAPKKTKKSTLLAIPSTDGPMLDSWFLLVVVILTPF
jgi:hypothetical protein